MSSKNNDVSFEEELLQLSEKKPPKKVKKESDEDETMAGESDDRRGKRKGKGDNKKPLKKRRADDEQSSDDDDVFHDGYEDDLMGDDEDRERLANLPEIEREEILDVRYEKRRELKEQWEMRRKLKNNKKPAEKDKKEREKRDTRGSSNTNKKKEKKALMEIKKKRTKAYEKDEDDEDDDEDEDKGDDASEEYKPAKLDRTSTTPHKERDTPSRVASDDDKRTDEDELTFLELNSIRLPRDSLLKWLDKPFFSDIVPGFFVRIGIGPDPIKQINVYRVAQVSDVQIGKATYTISGTNPGEVIPTNKILRLRIANKDKDCKMDTISNRSFTEPEYTKWLSEMRKVKEHIPGSQEVKDKLERLRIAHNYQYTSEDITKMLEEKRKVGKLPVKLAAERARLIALRDAAKDTENFVEYENLCKKLEHIERLAQERQERIALSAKNDINTINMKNKKANFDKSLAETNKEVLTNNELDPFSRRKTVTRVLLARKKTANEEQAGDQKAENGGGNINNTASESLRKSLGSSSDRLRDPAQGLHDEHSEVDIDISTDAATMSLNQPSAHPAMIPSMAPTQASSYISPSSTATPAAAKLSLADYMRRRREALE